MKVGITTLHYGFNFGGILQCLALLKTIEGLGHDVRVVHYNPNKDKARRWWQGWWFRGGMKRGALRARTLEFVHTPGSRRKFEVFRGKHLRLTERARTARDYGEVVSSFDALVAGSDQIWNFNYHVDSVYFLRFPGKFSGRRISYAACCGCPHEREEEWIGDALKEIDHLSVRNEITRDWVEQESGLTARIVGDPTFLYDFPEPEASKAPTEKGYIFTYYLSSEIDGGTEEVISRIKKRYGRDLKVVCVVATAHKMKAPEWADEVCYELDPFEWLAYLRNANFVYTDSFHAALFAAKAHVPFLAYYAEAQRSYRLIHLSEMLGLSGRLVNRADSTVDDALESPLDWGHSDSVVEKVAGSSVEFLKKALSNQS